MCLGGRPGLVRFFPWLGCFFSGFRVRCPSGMSAVGWCRPPCVGLSVGGFSLGVVFFSSVLFFSGVFFGFVAGALAPRSGAVLAWRVALLVPFLLGRWRSGGCLCRLVADPCFFWVGLVGVVAGVLVFYRLAGFCCGVARRCVDLVGVAYSFVFGRRGFVAFWRWWLCRWWGAFLCGPGGPFGASVGRLAVFGFRGPSVGGALDAACSVFACVLGLWVVFWGVRAWFWRIGLGPEGVGGSVWRYFGGFGPAALSRGLLLLGCWGAVAVFCGVCAGLVAVAGLPRFGLV